MTRLVRLSQIPRYWRGVTVMLAFGASLVRTEHTAATNMRPLAEPLMSQNELPGRGGLIEASRWPVIVARTSRCMITPAPGPCTGATSITATRGRLACAGRPGRWLARRAAG